MSSLHPLNALNFDDAQYEGIDDFGATLTKAAQAFLPTNTKRYGNAAVLFLSWTYDDMGIQGVQERLLNVFKNKYHFSTEKFAIPGDGTSREAENALIRTLLDFLATGAQNSEVFVDWMEHRTYTDHAQADTLYILDCCYASVAAIEDNNELLAASGRESTAGSELTTSFCSVFTNCMEALAGCPITVAQIHAHLLRFAHENRLQATPVHATLSRNRPSITLQALNQENTGTSFEERMQPYQAMGDSPLRVLIKVKIQGAATRPKIAEWTRWLTTNLPSNVAEISVEAAFEGNSTLLFVTVPLELWSSMEENEACTFIDFVQSENIVKEGLTGQSGFFGEQD
ncbi:MAG: hypothetical protein Q9188_004963 [Gyalolechia gomerana]